MEKEEIALKYVPCRCDESYKARNLEDPNCPYHNTDPISAMDEWAIVSGIHWFEIAKGELPPNDPDSHLFVSVEVLVTDGVDIAKARYSFTQKDFFFNGVFEPTHFAFINLPQTT